MYCLPWPLCWQWPQGLPTHRQRGRNPTSFITGEIPLRTGLTTVGQAGADVGMPAQAATSAAALKTQGYATGQFGKNHSSSGTTRRACTCGHFFPPKYQALMNSETNYGLEEAGMAQMDDCIGALMKHLEDIGEELITPSSSSPPTMAPKCSPGRMLA